MGESRQPTAFSYIRVSHRYSAVSGLSPGTQLDMCRQFYQNTLQSKGVLWYGLKEIPQNMNLTKYDDSIDLFYDPAVSARHVPLLARRAGARLNHALRAGDHVIFAHLDRGCRAILDHVTLVDQWHRREITIHYANMLLDLHTPHGAMIANIMAAVAQGESDLKSERQKEICARMKELNIPHGGCKRLAWKTIGEKGNRQYVPDWEGRAIMAEIVKLHDRDGLSFGVIGEQIHSRMCRVHAKTFRAGSHFGRKRIWTHDKVRKAYHDYMELVKTEGPQPNYVRAIRNKAWVKREAKRIKTLRKNKKKEKAALKSAKEREAARKAERKRQRERQAM